MKKEVKKRFNNWEKLVVFLVFAFTFLLVFVFARVGVDLHHDGLMYFPAQQMNKGRMLLTNVVSLYGYLTSLTYMWVLRLLGNRLLSLKLFTSVVYGLVAVCFYVVNKKIIGKVLAISSIILWLALAPMFTAYTLAWPSDMVILMQGLVILSLFAWTRTKKQKFLWWSGLAAGFALQYRINPGLPLLLVVVFLVGVFSKKKQRFGNVLRVLATSLSLYVPIVLWMGVNNGLTEWWMQSFVWPLEFSKYYDPQHNLVSVVKRLLTIEQFRHVRNWVRDPFWVIFPILSLFSFVWSGWKLLKDQVIRFWFSRPPLYRRAGGRAWLIESTPGGPCFQPGNPGEYSTAWPRKAFARGKRSREGSPNEQEQNRLVLVASMVAVSSWAQYYPISEFRHYHWAILPMVGVSLWMVKEIVKFLVNHFGLRGKGLVGGGLKVFVLIVSCGLFGWFLVIGWRNKLEPAKYALNEYQILKGLSLNKIEYEQLKYLNEELGEYFEQHPNKTYINLTIFGFLSSLHPNHYHPDSMYFYWEFISDHTHPAYWDKVSQYISRHQPVVLVSKPLELEGYIRQTSHLSQTVQILYPED